MGLFGKKKETAVTRTTTELLEAEARGEELTAEEAAYKEERMALRAKSDRMGTERIGKLMLEFSIPTIAGMMFSSLYNIIDTAFLGQAMPDGTGVAVTTLALPIMTILTGFSMMAGVGGNALSAIQMGERKKHLVERTLGNTAVLLFLISFLVGLSVVFFIDPILTVIGTPTELWEPTKTFVQITGIFFAFQSVGFGLNHFIRTAGRPVFAFMTNAVGTVCCIAFNYLFVLVLNWGVAGSAWANICGQLIAMIPVLWFFTLNKNTPFHLRWHCMAPKLRLMGRIIVMGLASFAMQVGGTVVSVVFNQVVGFYGAASAIGAKGALAAMGVAQKASWFAFTPIIGIQSGVQPLIGYNFGAKNWNRVIKLLKWSSLDGAFVGLFFFILVHLIPVQIVALFGVEGGLQEFAVWTLKVYTIWMPIVGYQAVAAGYFQSSGQPFKSMLLELLRQIIFLVPMYLFLPQLLMSLVGVTGLEGVALCVPASDMLATITTTIFVVFEVRKLFRWRREQEAQRALGETAGELASQGPEPAESV